MDNKYVIGIDFGTGSTRAIIVNAENGDEIASSVSEFKRWKEGLYCTPSQRQFRQHPLDYIEGLEAVINGCVAEVDDGVRQQIGSISVATTGSTPVAVNEQGIPLALLEGFQDNPNAMFILWKDHTAIDEAEEINTTSKTFKTNYLKYLGENYSSEWYWAKLLHTLKTDEKVRETCYTWVEQSDWIPFYLTGGKDITQLKRNVTAAGHKGLWANEFNGLPPVSFFEAIHPLLVPFVGRFGKKVYSAIQTVGNLSEELASKFGLSTNIKVGVGSVDAHVGAVGGMIKPYYMSKVIGTSTCDMMVVPKGAMEGLFIKGISGQVEDSIIPGMIGLEAGQSAFGDIYSWFKELLLWPLQHLDQNNKASKELLKQLESTVLKDLNQKASELALHEDLEFALDWFNGRRTPFVDPNLSGLIGNLTLGSTAPRVYRALVEATCFGSRAIADSIEEQGIKIEGVNAVGGIASKSEFVVQMMADVLNRPVYVAPTEQTVAIGAAMFASVVSGFYATLEDAIEAIGKKEGKVVNPRSKYVEMYDKRFKKYYKQYGNVIEQFT